MRRLNSNDLDLVSAKNKNLRFLVRKDSNDTEIIEEVVDRDIYGLHEHGHRPFKRILDLGGHIGTFAALASHTWPEARIVSFEPLKSNGDLFTINTGSFANVSLIRKVVVSDPATEVEFAASDHDSNQGGIHNSGSGKLNGEDNNYNERILVPAMHILDVFRAYGPFDFIKMDIEDAEYDVLQVMHDNGLIDEVSFFRGEFHRNDFLALKKPNFPNHDFGGVYIYDNMGYFYANKHGSL